MRVSSSLSGVLLIWDTEQRTRNRRMQQRKWAACQLGIFQDLRVLYRTGNLNLLQVLTSVLSCEIVHQHFFAWSCSYRIWPFFSVRFKVLWLQRDPSPYGTRGGKGLLASCREAVLQILVSMWKARVTGVGGVRQWFTRGSLPGSPALSTSEHSLKQMSSLGCQFWHLQENNGLLVGVFGAGHFGSNLLSLKTCTKLWVKLQNGAPQSFFSRQTPSPMFDQEEWKPLGKYYTLKKKKK